MLQKISPWLSRAVILAVVLLFTLIGLKFIFDPQASAANSGIILTPGVGFTNTRAGFGGFPLGFAAILAFCLFSTKRLVTALAYILTVATIILAVRLYGAVQDGTMGQSLHLVIPEAVILVISSFGIWMEMRRRIPARAAP
jgi:hypothetical protein